MCVYVYVGSVGSRVCLKCVYPCRVCSPDCVCVCVCLCACVFVEGTAGGQGITSTRGEDRKKLNRKNIIFMERKLQRPDKNAQRHRI